MSTIDPWNDLIASFEAYDRRIEAQQPGGHYCPQADGDFIDAECPEFGQCRCYSPRKKQSILADMEILKLCRHYF